MAFPCGRSVMEAQCANVEFELLLPTPGVDGRRKGNIHKGIGRHGKYLLGLIKGDGIERRAVVGDTEARVLPLLAERPHRRHDTDASSTQKWCGVAGAVWSKTRQVIHEVCRDIG